MECTLGVNFLKPSMVIKNKLPPLDNTLYLFKRHHACKTKPLLSSGYAMTKFREELLFILASTDPNCEKKRSHFVIEVSIILAVSMVLTLATIGNDIEVLS